MPGDRDHDGAAKAGVSKDEREELLACLDALSRLYGTTRAACKWLASGAPMG